jgi:hypothetical protein
MKWKVCLAAALMSATSLAHAITGVELQSYCENDDPRMCFGYIEGVIDAQTSWELGEMIRKAVKEHPDQAKNWTSIVGAAPKYCLSAPITREQSREVVSKYLRANPKELYRPADTLVGLALTAAFPCPKQK